ncbi:MAG: molybdate ABC transporter substrate-binding protein [Azospirillum sp.]|nr:molybdate ABC transporter substrate-binding protein [Azospirillum sp.]MCA3264784.1 molybdate ABC transporter substrate-binding protein [Azospirillum sp.]MCZ8124678.1 molybdate ABC transporter substrate-binding protein [Magnetospirillum sp.]
MMFRAFAVLAVCLSCATHVRAQTPQITVYAAASLAGAFEAMVEPLRAQGISPRFSFAASSTLARQIEQGALADVFASADEEWMDHLGARGLVAPGTRRVFAGNRLVLIAPADRPRAADIGPATDFAALLGPGGRLAVGDPAHVPAGRYARQAFEALGRWSDLRGRIAAADNVRAALALVERGEAPLGVVYATDARASARVAVVGIFPADLHPPIVYPAAIVARRDAPAARAFLAYLESADGKAVLRRFGFTTD